MSEVNLVNDNATTSSIGFIDFGGGCGGRYANTSGLMGFRKVSNMLGIKKADLASFLVDRGYMYVRKGCWELHPNFKESGYGVVKTFTTGWGASKKVIKFTSKGVEMLAGKITK